MNKDKLLAKAKQLNAINMASICRELHYSPNAFYHKKLGENKMQEVIELYKKRLKEAIKEP